MTSVSLKNLSNFFYRMIILLKANAKMFSFYEKIEELSYFIKILESDQFLNYCTIHFLTIVICFQI